MSGEEVYSIIQDTNDVLHHLVQVQYGVILAIGVVAGVLLIHLFLRKF